MEESNNDLKLKLKLLFDKKNMKVLFAEANKEFVDFLFSLMSLPLGKVVKLLKDDSMFGSLSDLFGSIESLDDTYLQSSENVKSILDPKPAATIAFKTPLLLSDCESFVNRKAYMCLNQIHNFGSTTVYHPYMSNAPDTVCPSCENPMNYELQLVDSNSANQAGVAAGGGGFVKGVVTYMVMDNLEVKPLSTISSIVLINSFNIHDLSCLEEMIVDVGPTQALKLLRASFDSKNVLTSVFLDKKQAN